MNDQQPKSAATVQRLVGRISLILKNCIAAFNKKIEKEQFDYKQIPSEYTMVSRYENVANQFLLYWVTNPFTNSYGKYRKTHNGEIFIIDADRCNKCTATSCGHRNPPVIEFKLGDVVTHFLIPNEGLCLKPNAKDQPAGALPAGQAD